MSLTKKYKLKPLKSFGLQISANSECNHIFEIDAAILKGLVHLHKVVLLRGFSAIDKTSLVAYAKTMGNLMEWEFGNVMEMRAQEKPKNYLFTEGQVPFHWDGAFKTVPSFLLFNCIEPPLKNCGGETIFADTNCIWECATDEEKKEWESLQLTYQTEKLAHYGGRFTEFLIKKHPVTNKKIIRFGEPVPPNMLNPVEVFVENKTEKESKKIIKTISKRCYRKQFCYTHKWQQHDFLIADNHALLHARRAFKHFSPRHLRRIQVL